jgi:Flp pilus assembly pilin Flp
MRDGRTRSDRGASTIEYVLLLGFVAIVVISAVKVFGRTQSSRLTDAATQVGGKGPGSSGTPTTTSGPVSDAGSGGSTGGGSTATLPPDTSPDTVPVTTTTTASPVTSPPTTFVPVTTPPTTLPPVATKGSTELTEPTTSHFGSIWWGTSQLIVTDNLGAAVSGARVTITISAYTRQSNGRYDWETSTQTLTTDFDGSVGLVAGLYGSTVTKATVAVSAVTLPNGLAWDGDPSTVTVNGP